jgi:hypothetical protein
MTGAGREDLSLINFGMHVALTGISDLCGPVNVLKYYEGLSFTLTADLKQYER